MRIIEVGIKKNRAGYITIAICSAIVSLIILSLFVLHFSLDKTFENYYKKIHGPLCVIATDDEESENNLVELLSKRKNISYESFQRHVTKGISINDRDYSFAYVVTGKTQIPTDATVFVNNVVSNSSVGKSVEFNCDDDIYSIEKVVMDPINSAPDTMNTVIYVNENIYRKLAAFGINNESLYYLYGDSDQIAEELETEYLSSYGISLKGNVTSFKEIKQHYLLQYRVVSQYFNSASKVVIIFIFFLCALIINMILAADCESISIYRIIGMNRTRVVQLYSAKTLLPAILGAIAGVLTGMIILMFWLGKMFSAFGHVRLSIYGLFWWAFLSLGIVLAILFILTLVLVYVRLEDTNYIVRIEEKKTRLSIRRGIFGGLFRTPEMVSIGMSYAKKHIAQTLAVTVSTIFLGSMIVFTAHVCLGILERNNHLVEWGIADMDIYVSRVNNTSEKQSGLLDYLEKDDRVDYFYAALTDSVYYKTEGLSGNVLADIYENEILSDMEETIVEGRNPENLEEIAIGTRFARNNNVSLGEKIEIAHGNNSSTYTVCGIYASYKDSANSVRYIVDDIVKYFDNKADGYYSIVLKNNSELSAVIADLSAFEDYRFIPMRRSLKSIINSIIVPVAIMVMALILTFMAIIRVLLTVMIISRRKELVTYSYYGATKRDICSNVRASILAPAIIGTAIAIPISILYIPMLFKDIVFELGMKTVPIYPSIISVTISIFIMIAFTVVTLNKRSIVRLMNQ